MNGVSALAAHRGFPATAVVKLTPHQAARPSNGRPRGSETVLAAVANPPRGGEPRPLAALVPQVLERYGLGSRPAIGTAIDCTA
jgi:hypothetical protein